MSKTNKLAQVIRKIVREEVQKEVRNILNEQKEKSNKKSLTLTEALQETAQDDYQTIKTFSAADARAGFASLQGNMNTQQPIGFEGHNGRVVPTEKVDPSLSKAMTRDYSELVKRFKK
tara:strand:- start:50 stop:403 length:354 start_codon:yes stop_codon:yes gene_type:complete